VVQPTDEPTGRTSMIFYVDTWRSMQLTNGKRVSEIIDEKLKKIGQIT